MIAQVGADKHCLRFAFFVENLSELFQRLMSLSGYQELVNRSRYFPAFVKRGFQPFFFERTGKMIRAGHDSKVVQRRDKAAQATQVNQPIPMPPVGNQRIMTRTEPKFPVAVVLYDRSEEHTSELQSLMRISYAVFCLKKKKHIKQHTTTEM